MATVCHAKPLFSTSPFSINRQYTIPKWIYSPNP